MDKTKANPEPRIGLLLSGPEGGGEVVHCLKKAGYAVGEPGPLEQADVSALRTFDLLILSGRHWPAVRHLLEADGEGGTNSRPSLIVCGAPPAGLSTEGRAEPDENIAFLSCPPDPQILLLQVKALWQQRQILEDVRYRLREREDVLRSISEVFFSVDHNFCYTFFNEKAEKIGGKSAEEVLGKDMWEMFPFLKNTEFHRQMQQAAVDRKIFVSEYLGAITGGWFEMRIYPSAGGLSALFVDISARKKAEEELKRAQEQLTAANGNLERAVEERTAQLHHANERLEELLYSIAHDLRSPLRSMQGFAQAFVEDFSPALDDRAREYAGRMTSAAIFMDRMLSDLIALGRVTKTEVQLESVDLAEAWNLALAQHEEKIKSTKAKIETSPALGEVTANMTLLVQILANLLGNALKFMQKDVRPEITIWTEPLESSFLGIYVEDNGIGIEERYQEKIFRVFERLNGSDYEGTGIGLAIARKAAERMKGRLDFTSSPGKGTKFRLKLPGNRGGTHGVPAHDSHRRG